MYFYHEHDGERFERPIRKLKKWLRVADFEFQKIQVTSCENLSVGYSSIVFKIKTSIILTKGSPGCKRHSKLGLVLNWDNRASSQGTRPRSGLIGSRFERRTRPWCCTGAITQWKQIIWTRVTERRAAPCSGLESFSSLFSTSSTNLQAKVNSTYLIFILGAAID